MDSEGQESSQGMSDMQANQLEQITMKKTATPKPPMLTVSFHWSGDIPRKIKKQWEAMFKPKTVTFKIPKD